MITDAARTEAHPDGVSQYGDSDYPPWFPVRTWKNVWKSSEKDLNSTCLDPVSSVFCY